MIVDSRGENLVFLEGASSQLVRVKVDEIVDGTKLDRQELSHLGVHDLRGLAIHPATGHLYVLSQIKQILYELEESGQLVAEHDSSDVDLSDPHTLVFAASSDLTDSASTFHLFIAVSDLIDEQPDQEDPATLPNQLFLPFTTQDTDSSASLASPAGGQKAGFDRIVEVTLEPRLPEVSVASIQATTLGLVQPVDASAFSPSSPDPSGIAYIPGEDILLIVDGEVDEMPALFTGKNVFGVTRTGSLAYTRTTLPWSYEPTDVAYNPHNGHLLYSDDDKKKINEVNQGPDGVHGTSDDILTTFLTSAFNSMDPEGLTYDPASGDLFIVDGVNNEVYRVNPGPNGIFDGIPAKSGDDVVTQFDTLALGIQDPEGIDIDASSGNLVLTGKSNVLLYEVTTSGSLVKTFDLSAANGRKLAGVAIAPGSIDPAVASYFIVDRGVDNDSDPNENDGKIYEFSSGPPPPLGDVIFADNFEAGNFSLWSASSTGGGDLSVSPTAALVGNQGLRAVINDNSAIYLTDDRPLAESRYRARFYFDPNSIVMASGDAHYIFYGYTGTSPVMLRVEFRFSNGAYQLRAALLNDATTWSSSSWFTITDAGHFIELDWQASSAVGANNGSLAFWIDGVQQVNITGIDNDTRRIDRVRLGVVSGIDTGTRGTYFFDAFESTRQTYIGPVADGPTPTPTSLPTNTPTATPTRTPTVAPTATPTVAPTNTPPPAGDVIFADDFETGNLSLWSASITDGGNLSVSPTAALAGGQGLRAVINDNNAIHLTGDQPLAEPRYRARFYFDPNSIVMASGNAHYIFYGYAGTFQKVVRVEFRFSNGAYQLRAALLNDATTWSSSSWFTITDAGHFIELDWQAASAAGANNGSLAFWIDGVQRVNITGIDNDTRRIDRVRLGVVSGIDTGTRGTYYLDAFESRRQTYIGPDTDAKVPVGDGTALDPSVLQIWTEEEDIPEENEEFRIFLPVIPSTR